VWLRRYGMPRSRAAWLFAKLAIRLFAQRSAARVVHVTDPNALVLLQGRQMLTTVYDLTPLLEPNSDRRFFEGRDYLHYLKRLQRVDRIFAISNQTAEDLRQHRGIPGSRIVLAPPGVDLVLTPRGYRRHRSDPLLSVCRLTRAAQERIGSAPGADPGA